MNVLVIPEDVVKDGDVLKPIISAMLRKVGQVHAEVRACQSPRLGGIGEALKWENQEAIIRRYRQTDLFILCVDRDGVDGRRQSLDHLEHRASEILPADRLYLAVDAWQEIEVWVLAGHDLPREWNWAEVRQERDPKEMYFETFAARRAGRRAPVGRKDLAEEAARRYDRIRRRCPDVLALERRIAGWLEGQK